MPAAFFVAFREGKRGKYKRKETNGRHICRYFIQKKTHVALDKVFRAPARMMHAHALYNTLAIDTRSSSKYRERSSPLKTSDLRRRKNVVANVAQRSRNECDSDIEAAASSMQLDSEAPARASRRSSWHDRSAQSLVSYSHGWPKIVIVSGGIPELCDLDALSRFNRARILHRGQ